MFGPQSYAKLLPSQYPTVPFPPTLILIHLRHSSNTNIVTQLAFSPTENLIAWTAADGTFTRWPKAIPDKHPHPVHPIPKAANSEAPVAKLLASGIFDNEDEVDIEVDNLDNGEEAGDDMSEASVTDWVEEDANAGRTGPARADFVKEMGKLQVVDSSGVVDMLGHLVSITKAQPPFQPGATPMFQTKRMLGRLPHSHPEVVMNLNITSDKQTWIY
jgi:chromosome transmission fidelity protein 4